MSAPSTPPNSFIPAPVAPPPAPLHVQQVAVPVNQGNQANPFMFYQFMQLPPAALILPQPIMQPQIVLLPVVVMHAGHDDHTDTHPQPAGPIIPDDE